MNSRHFRNVALWLAASPLVGAFAGQAAAQQFSFDSPTTDRGILIGQGASIKADLHKAPPATSSELSSFIKLDPLPGHQYSPVVTAIATDATTRTLVAAGDDHAIRWIDLTNGKTRATLKGHTSWVRQLAFLETSDKSLSLVSCSDDGRLIQWTWPADDVAKLEQQELLHCDHTLTAMALDRASKKIALGGFSHELLIVAWNTPKQIQHIKCVCGDQRALVYSQDGQHLIAGGRAGSVFVYSAESGKLEKEHKLHRGRLRSLSLDDSGRVLTTVGEDHRVNELDWNTGKVQVQSTLPTGKLLSLALLKDGRVVTAGADNTVAVLNRHDGSVLQQLVGHDGSVAVMETFEDYLITAGFDTTIRLWDLTLLPAVENATKTIVHPVRSQFFDSGVNEPIH